MYKASCRYTGFSLVSMTTKHAQYIGRLENGCIHAQAQRIAEPKHSRQQIDRVRGDDVLAKEHCLYERDRRLRCEDEKMSQCNVRVVTFLLRS